MRVAIGQDSHRFVAEDCGKKLILGGVVFEDAVGLEGNSDADVVLHAVTNAVSGITCKNVLGKVADELCKQGITDSEVYLKKALEDLKYEIIHLSISIECKTPKIAPKIEEMRANIARILNIKENEVGITATTGEGLTDFGRGKGISVFCVITTQ